MKITLEVVRSILKAALGRESFVASFVTRVNDADNCPTASINSDGQLRYNPSFVTKFVACEEDLFCLVLHEIMHPMFGHFVYNGGMLENLAADTIINASISLLFPKASGEGCLFKKVYTPHGMEGLLRPMSRMHDSRYGRLYEAFYGSGCGKEFLSTGEIIQTLKVLTPMTEVSAVLLLGTHGSATELKQDGLGLGGLSAEVLCRIAEGLKKSAQAQRSSRAGYGDNLYELFLEAIKTPLSIRKGLLQKFATRRKIDKFRQAANRPAVTVSPIPLRLSKRDLVLLSGGISPFHYHHPAQRVATKEHGLVVYLDVSGSVNHHPPDIIGVLSSLKSELTSIFLFSNKVVEVPFKTLLAGQVQTTYGTDFDCIAESIIERGFDKAVILTDGYASLDEGKQSELKKRKVQVLTILFGGKTDCAEFAPLGDVVQLDDITQ